MTNKELQETLQRYPDDYTIITGCWNKYTETYCVVDHLFKITDNELDNDLYGTPGRTDRRLIDPNVQNYIYLGSLFGTIPNKDVDFGDDNINTPIKLINGEEGDPALVFKLSGFVNVENDWYWVNATGTKTVYYFFNNNYVAITNHTDNLTFSGTCVGIEDLRNALRLCKIDLTIIT